MKKFLKDMLTYCICAALLVTSFLTPTAFAASDVYELTFDNLFVFEQWANHGNLKVLSGGGELTTDIENGSFVLVNNTDNTEVYTSFSMGSVGAFYSMPVTENTDYMLSFEVNGTTSDFEANVFYFDTNGAYHSLVALKAYQYGLNEFNFTTPENTGYIQVRFDNNSPKTNVTVSNIRISSKAVYEYAKNNISRKAFTYSAGNKYGELPVPQRDNLVFAGWFTGPDGTGKKITSDTIAIPASRCLYSKWDPIVNEVLNIVSLPQKQNYSVGEKLNTRGLVIGVTYPDGKRENIDEGFYCSPEILTNAGTQTILVTYGNGSAEFTVNVKNNEEKTIFINNSQKVVSSANHMYTIGYNGSEFNQYEINYSSDAYVKGELNFNGTIEEFFLEPAENGNFASYIDGFLDNKTQTAVTSISFSPLDKEYMNFAVTSLNLSKITAPCDSNGMVYLPSTDYKIGIDLDWGGALTYMEDLTNNVVAAKDNENSSATVEVGYSDDFSGTYKSGCDTLEKYTKQSNINLINRNDTGRLVQQSYYGTGSYPYEPSIYDGNLWNYNPVQGGNLYNEASKIVDLKVSTNEIYIKCRPLDWAKTAEYITPSYMEAWYTLEDGLMRATCRFVDFSGYPGVTTTQEFPAFYCVEPLDKFVYFSGGEAWSDSNTKKTATELQFWGDPQYAPNQTFICNENWGAFIGDGESGYSIGLYAPGQTNFFTGVFGRGGITELVNNNENIDEQDPTSYIGVVDTINFQSYKPISYCYYISTGTVDEIRSRFKPLAEKETDICNATNTNGFCDMCKKPVEPTLTNDKYDVNGDGSKDAVYEISSVGELYWFRDTVNNGVTSVNAVLTCDITDNESVLSGYGILADFTSNFRAWTPIGTASQNYNGIFDGQGHTINGLYMNDSTALYGGLFGYTGSSAVIKRVGIDDSYLRANQYVGGICGYNNGKIDNCYAFYLLAKGTSYVGGITGYNAGTIQNCYNAGVINAVNYIGGLTGYKTNSSKITNSYYLINSATDGAGAVQYGVGNGTQGSSTADADWKTIEQFASGEVASLLQDANTEQLWGQKTTLSGFGPVFDTSGEYKVLSSDGSYSLVTIGDVNEDEILDEFDYQQQINSVLSQQECSYNEMLHLDIDGDGYLDVIDCSLMQLMVTGLLDKVEVYLKGDFDFDGVAFTDADKSAIKKALIGNYELSTRQKYVCDLNFDGVLDVNDKDILMQEKQIGIKQKTGAAQDSRTANVIIISGQSNAYGASPLTAEVKAQFADIDFSNIKIKYNNINTYDGTNWETMFSNDSFETFKVGIGGQAEGWFGPELGLAYHLATNESTKNEVWYIIKYTAAGTFLGGDWLNDTTGNYANEQNHANIYNSLGGYLADNMVDYVSDALDEIESKHSMGKVNIRSFLWHQGESDSGFEQWANQYGELQNMLVNKVRTAFDGRDADAHIGFVDGGIAAYNSNTFYNELTGVTQTYNNWVYSDTVNTHKSNNAMLWYVPKDTQKNIINMTTAGLYENTTNSTTKLANSIWIDTSTCKSKYENNNENGEFDGAHYCGESMFIMGIWYAQGMLVVSNF